VIIISFGYDLLGSLVLLILIIPELIYLLKISHFLVRRNEFFFFDFVILSFVVLLIDVLGI